MGIDDMIYTAAGLFVLAAVILGFAVAAEARHENKQRRRKR